VLRSSAPGARWTRRAIYIFFTFFRKQRFGYAAVLSLVLFAIVIGLTVMQRKMGERSVHYGD